MKISKIEAIKLGILSKILNVCQHDVNVNKDDEKKELEVKVDDFIEIITNEMGFH